MKERATTGVCDTEPVGAGGGIARQRRMTLCFALLVVALGSARVAAGSPPTDTVPSPAKPGTPGDSTPRRVAAPTSTIVGVVRSGATGQAVVDASIETGDSRWTTTSDRGGGYQLRDIPAETGEIHVIAAGYVPLTIAVSAPPGGVVRVDVLLTPLTITLAPLHITAPAIRPPLGPVTLGKADRTGAWQWRGGTAAMGTGEPDVFRLLGDDPNVIVHPDGPDGVMDRGGGGNDIQVLLDGLPVWNPVHAGNGLSVISPDAVDGLTLYDGAAPAQYGDRLGSVLNVHTRDVLNDSASGSVSFGSTASRVMMTSPLSLGALSGGILLAARRSNADLFPARSTSEPFLGRWADGIGGFALMHGATTIRFLALSSDDRLTPTGGNQGTSSATGAQTVRFPWQTQTLGTIWVQRVAPAARIETRLWQTDFQTSAQERIDTTVSTLDNGVRQQGASSQLIWKGTTIGASVEGVSTHYRVTDVTGGTQHTTTGTESDSGTSGQSARLLAFRAHPTLVAAFAGQSVGSVNGPWFAQAGLRATELVGAGVSLDPRVSLALRLGDAVQVTGGYTRTHQFIQSLRNQNAPMSALIGVDLPVAAGFNGVPIARSDAVTTGITTRLGSHARFMLDGYVRWLAGLAIPDPTSTHLFADRGFDIANGRAAGVDGGVAGQTGQWTWEAMYGLGRMQYVTSSLGAPESSKLSQTATASVALQLDRLTQFRFVGWGAAGPQVAQALWLNQLSGGSSGGSGTGGTGGTGERGDGETDPTHALGQGTGGEARFLSYVRFDLHLTHDWPTGPGRGQLSMFLTLANIFNRTNVAAYSLSATSQTVTFPPRSLLAGLTWRY